MSKFNETLKYICYNNENCSSCPLYLKINKEKQCLFVKLVEIILDYEKEENKNER